MKNLSILFVLIILTCCINNAQKRGYSFEFSDYKLIKEGISSKQTVLNFMGSPTLISYIDDQQVWIYFAEDVEKLLFFKPQIRSRQVMTLSFDKTDIVKQVNSYSLKDEQQISFSGDYTKVKSRKEGFWSQLFGNIGQVYAN